MADSKIILSKDLMDKVVEELNEYREIGTVEEFKELLEYRAIGSVDKIKGSIETNYVLLHAYEEIGTVEEFKALKEKSEPKKPIYSDFEDNGNDESIPYKAICPVCGYEFNFGSWNEEENHHCRCGQAIDWQ